MLPNALAILTEFAESPPPKPCVCNRLGITGSLIGGQDSHRSRSQSSLHEKSDDPSTWWIANNGRLSEAGRFLAQVQGSEPSLPLQTHTSSSRRSTERLAQQKAAVFLIQWLFSFNLTLYPPL